MEARIFLGGLDWVIHALDSATRRVCPTGNHSQVVLQLDGPLDDGRLAEALGRFSGAFPVLNGRMRRRWTLEPYWNCSRRAQSPSIRLEILEMGEEDPWTVLERCANTPFRHRCEYVAFQSIHRAGGPCFLAMKFDHRLLDARGAEQLLHLFGRYADGAIALEELRGSCMPVRPSLLNRWKERFLSGRSLLRATRPLAECEIAGLVDRDANGGASSFVHLELDAEESKRFTDRAYRAAGFLMFLPYALSAAIRVFDAVCRRPGRRGDYVVPCTVDLRGPDAPLDKLFFNSCSMLFFRVGAQEMADPAALVASLKTQLYSQRKEGLPEHFERVMALMRILPVRVFDWMMCRHMRHCFGSFSFASLGAGFFEQSRFMGLVVKNVFHMPQVPPQTGLGFFFNQFQGRINVGVSFREGLLDADARKQLAAKLKDACLGLDDGGAEGYGGSEEITL